jgi:hypothetical protein
VTRLYFAVLSIHCHALAEAWLWITSIVTMDPRPTTANLLYTFMQTMRKAMYNHYGTQFVEGLHFINNDYLKKIENVSFLG